jgi:hypothetical protein
MEQITWLDLDVYYILLSLGYVTFAASNIFYVICIQFLSDPL